LPPSALLDMHTPPPPPLFATSMSGQPLLAPAPASLASSGVGLGCPFLRGRAPSLSSRAPSFLVGLSYVLLFPGPTLHGLTFTPPPPPSPVALDLPLSLILTIILFPSSITSPPLIGAGASVASCLLPLLTFSQHQECPLMRLLLSPRPISPARLVLSRCVGPSTLS